MSDHDVVVIGAGGDGPALAWRLGQYGLDVLVIEAGPWHGNEQWPNSYEEPGATQSDDPESLNGSLMDEQLHRREQSMNDPVSGKLRVGPADRDRAPWFRNQPQNMFIWQVAGVGGTTLHYFGNHPRSYPHAFEEQDHWEIEYDDLVPYYQLMEEELPVLPAPTTEKEDLYYYGAEQAGYDLLDQKNVTEEGYRPQPNAIAHPDERLAGNYDGDFSYPDIEGSTLSGHHFQGGSLPLDAPVREKARKSSNVGWVPRALDTGNVTIRPNTYVTNVNTESGLLGTDKPTATGVDIRDTWSGETDTITGDVIVMAGGCIETPRLWLNSGLPQNDWVGKGLTTHWFDWVVGTFDEEDIQEAIGSDTVRPYVGQNSAARFDSPGLGGLELIGTSPGLTAFANYSFSQAGYNFDTVVDDDAPWDSRGRIVDEELKERMADYERTLSILVITDDLPRQDNGVEVDPVFADEHGPVPQVEWEPHPDDDAKRDELAGIAGEILSSAGANHVHRSDWPPLLLHIQSSMAQGKVVDENCEAYDVDRLFIGDHSAMANGGGSPNPTHTGQALALRTADQIEELYF